MANPEYFRLIKGNDFAGFKRIVTEYLPPGSDRWQLEPVEHDADNITRLSRPAVGIESLKRAIINSRD